VPHVAEVVDVVQGKFPYAVTEVDKIDGTVTFSLEKSHGVWNQNRLPLKGETVVLSDIAHMEDKGWRALSARPYTPEDKER
jgi:hypothetical protein